MTSQSIELSSPTSPSNGSLSDPHLLLDQPFNRSARTLPTHRLANTIAAFLARYSNAETRRTYAKVLYPFAETAGAHSILDSITPEILDSWQQSLCFRGLAQATVASRTKMMKAFWNWCVRREYIRPSPARFLVVRQPSLSLVSKAIPSDMLAAMFEAAHHKPSAFLAARDSAILALFITYGARVGDVARLMLEDIRLQERQIIFHVKGNKEHRLPLPDQTRRYLASWLHWRAHCAPDPAHEYVFVSHHTRPHHRHTPLTATGMATMIRRLAHQAGGTGYGPHAIRHWRGQSLADHQVAPTVVQAILGHSSVRITLDHYYNQDWERVQRILTTHDLLPTHHADVPYHLPRL